MIIKSFLLGIILAIITLYLKTLINFQFYFNALNGLDTFYRVFGTLYGIMSAFVVVQVWGQFNKTKELIELEALGLERLYRLTFYFRDKPLLSKMKKAIKDYSQLVIEGKFLNLAKRERNTKAGHVFRQIAEIISSIKFDDDHDAIVFDHIISHYGKLSETRTQRIQQSLKRLPGLLKAFAYLSSLIVIFTAIITPYPNNNYAFFTITFLTFVISIIINLVEGLDNPFTTKGEWTITTEPFERALKHIDEDY